MKTMIKVFSIALVMMTGTIVSAEPVDLVTEVGCGSCIYEMEGVDKCVAAVLIDGHPYLVEGIKGLDAHAAGLCKSAQHARVAGEVKDGVFKAKGMQLADVDGVVEAGCAACTYHIAGVQGCQTAVKVDGKPYIVTGKADADAMGLGLCLATKNAKVVGFFKDGKINAFSMKFLLVDQDAEVGCAKCSYKMDGVSDCVAAVKIDEKAYLIEGLPKFNAHTEGLCDAPKMGHIQGNIENGHFVAESLTLKAAHSEASPHHAH